VRVDRAIRHERHQEREDHEGIFDDNTGRIIGLAIRVYRRLGPGLLELAYEQCLCWELGNSGLSYARQLPLSLTDEDVQLACVYRADIIVDQQTILEIKFIRAIAHCNPS
jgi:GxxExxY protein